MATIERRGKGYRVRWRDPTGKQRSRQMPSRKAAKQLFSEVEEAEALGRVWNPSRHAPVLEDAFRDFLSDRARVLKAETLSARALILDLFLGYLRQRTDGAPLHLDVLSRETLSGFWSWLSAGEHRRPVLPSTANSYTRLVHRAWEWIWDSDAYADDCPRPRKLDFPKTSTRLAPYAPTWPDVDAAIAAAKHWHRHLLIVLRFTGLRMKQAMGLRWDDIDLDGALLTIRPEQGKSQSESRGRIIPMSKYLVAELAGWGRRDGWLIVPRGRTRYPAKGVIRSIWARTDVDPSRYAQPAHCFRRCLQSHFQSAGVAYNVAEYMIGHKVGVGGDVYTAPWAYMEAMRRAVATIPPLDEGNTVDLDARRASNQDP